MKTNKILGFSPEIKDRCKSIITLLLVIYTIIFSCSLQAQYNITGKVNDAISGEKLQGATLSLEKFNLKTTSDQHGKYIFNNLAAGNYLVKASYVGYHDTIVEIKISSSSVNFNFQLISTSVDIASLVVTATRTEKNKKDIPASIGIISSEQIQNLPALTADELLSIIPGINTTRHFGIFYKTGDVTMRGLNRNVHTLLLIDGIPLSIIDGGATNWNRVDPNEIEKIEVIKGPNSSLYGSNAMGGVVNIISKKDLKPFKGTAALFYGTYGTLGGSLGLRGSRIKNDKGWYWSINGKIRKSDGYIVTPDSIRDSTDVRAYLREYHAWMSTGYSFNKKNNIELQYDFSDDTRGIGKKIFESDGNFDHYLNHFIQARYRGSVGNVNISAVAFFKTELLNNQKESMKQNGSYIFFNNNSYSNDKGVWCNATFPVFINHKITLGFDSKLGVSSSSDIYHTSTDTIRIDGNMDYYGLYIQDDFPILKNKIKAIIGARYDNVKFYNGNLTIKEPSVNSLYMLPYLNTYENKNWNALSPKAGILFDIFKNANFYISISKGFRSSTLTDLCKTGDVNKGFKLANPLLKPEYIQNIELGTNLNFMKNLNIEAVIFYSVGKDFQYFVGTGDSLYTTKTKMQPVLKRENIGKVEMYGLELGVNYIVKKNMSLFGNYTYNHSIIKDFNVEGYVQKSLTGKYLIDVPMHQVFAGIILKNKYANFSFTYKNKSSTWADDENTLKVKGFSLFDCKISHRFADKIDFSVTVENIFNTIYLNSKYELPPGRFIIAEIKVMF